MESYEKSFDDVEDVEVRIGKVRIGIEWKNVDLFEFLEAERVGSAMYNQIIHFIIKFKNGDFIRSNLLL